MPKTRDLDSQNMIDTYIFELRLISIPETLKKQLLPDPKLSSSFG